MAGKSIFTSGLAGLPEIREVLRTLPKETEQKVIAVAMRRAAKPLVSAAKQFAPKRTGALKESIGFVVRKGRNGRSSYAAVGPASGYYRGGAAVKHGASVRGADNPAKYAHLVEFGHVAVKPQKNTSRRKRTAQAGRFVPAKPFMRPALLAASDAVATELAAGVEQGIAQALKRLAKNPAARG